MFKHPSKSTIDRINEYIFKKKIKKNEEKGKIYRTDEMGEVVMKVD
jgi:hypothetical protein